MGLVELLHGGILSCDLLPLHNRGEVLTHWIRTRVGLAINDGLAIWVVLPAWWFAGGSTTGAVLAGQVSLVWIARVLVDRSCRGKPTSSCGGVELYIAGRVLGRDTIAVGVSLTPGGTHEVDGVLTSL